MRVTRISKSHLNLSLSLAALALLTPAEAVAAGARAIRFKLERQPVSTALLGLARQAGISIGGDIAKCSGTSGLDGNFSVRQALDAVLQTSNCGYLFADEGTVVVHVRGSAARRTDPRPRAPEPARPPETPAIIVTAPRRPTRLEAAPLSIAIEEGARMPAAGIRDLGDLATDVVGLTVTNLGPGRDKVFVRGLSDGVFTGSTQGSVSLYLDDLPITYNAPDPGLRLTDMERVEVVRGPQGALYGGGAIGGVVRIVPKTPSLDAYEARLTLDTGATRDGKPSAAGEAVLNLPLIKGVGALRMAVYRETDGGYIDNPALGLRDINQTTRGGARISGLVDAGNGWRVGLSGVAQKINTADGQYVSDGAGRLAHSTTIREPHENDFADVSARLDGPTRWGDLTINLGQIHHRLNTRYDATAVRSLFGLPQDGPVAYDEARHINLVIAEATLTSRGHGRLDWLVGAFVARDEDNISTRIGSPITADQTAYSEVRTDERLETALFGQLDYRLSRRWALTVGLRSMVSQLTVKSQTSQPLAASGSARLDDRNTFTGASPKLALAYSPSTETLVYVQYAQGYRAGGFNTAGPLSTASREPPEEFAPDSAWTLETGVKTTLLDRRLAIRASIYDTYWSNIQSDQFSPIRLPYTTNVGDGQIRGIELETAWRPSANLTVRGGAIFSDPQLTAHLNPAFPAKSDAGLPGVPAHSFNASVDYRRQITPRLLALVDARLAYVGRSNLTFDNQTRAEMGGYSTARISASLEAEQWTLTGYIDNPAGVRGNTFAFGNPFSFPSEKQSTPVRPTTVGLQISAHF